MAQVKRNVEPENNPAGFESLYRGFIGFLQRQAAATRLVYLVLSLILAAVLITIASLPFVANSDLNFISVLIGFPAGIILFLNIVGLAYFSGYHATRAFTWKERALPARRLRTVIIWAVVVTILFILLHGANADAPYGLGGALVITAALTGYNLVRRTPEELRLARLGLPDPREPITEEQE